MAEGEQPVPAYIQALLEQTADNLETLQRTLSRVEEGRTQGTQALSSLAERLTQFTDQMRAQQALLARFAENQAELKPHLMRLGDVAGKMGTAAGPAIDETTRAHIRNLDILMARLIEETAAGRIQMTQDLRNEIRLLARTIAALAEEGR
jgi:septal ring factor EnvC (AmiA/AmiB activator)